MIIEVNDNKNVLSSILYEVNKTLFLNKYYKRSKPKIKTPESIKNKFYLLIIRLKKMYKDNLPILYQITFCPLVFMRKK